MDTPPDSNEQPNGVDKGLLGLHRKYWDSKEIENGVEFSLTTGGGNSKDGGKVNIVVRYTLTLNEIGEGKLKIDMNAWLPDGEKNSIPINLCNHSYFNLAGHGSKNGIVDH